MTKEKQKQLPPEATEAQRIAAARADAETEAKRLELAERAAELGGERGIVTEVFKRLHAIAKFRENPFASHGSNPGMDAQHWKELGELLDLYFAMLDGARS